MRTHANAVAENCAARVRTGWINSDDSDRLALLAILARELVDQRALPCARCAGESDHAGTSGVREQGLQQVRRLRRAIFDGSNGARQGTRISREDFVNDR